MDQDLHGVVIIFFAQYLDPDSGVGPDLVQVFEQVGVGMPDRLDDAVITALQLIQGNLGLLLDASLVVRDHVAMRVDFREAKEFIEFVN